MAFGSQIKVQPTMWRGTQFETARANGQLRPLLSCPLCACDRCLWLCHTVRWQRHHYQATLPLWPEVLQHVSTPPSFSPSQINYAPLATDFLKACWHFYVCVCVVFFIYFSECCGNTSKEHIRGGLFISACRCISVTVEKSHNMLMGFVYVFVCVVYICLYICLSGSDLLGNTAATGAASTTAFTVFASWRRYIKQNK